MARLLLLILLLPLFAAADERPPVQHPKLLWEARISEDSIVSSEWFVPETEIVAIPPGVYAVGPSPVFVDSGGNVSERLADRLITQTPGRDFSLVDCRWPQSPNYGPYQYGVLNNIGHELWRTDVSRRYWCTGISDDGWFVISRVPDETMDGIVAGDVFDGWGNTVATFDGQRFGLPRICPDPDTYAWIESRFETGDDKPLNHLVYTKRDLQRIRSAEISTGSVLDHFPISPLRHGVVYREDRSANTLRLREFDWRVATQSWELTRDEVWEPKEVKNTNWSFMIWSDSLPSLVVINTAPRGSRKEDTFAVRISLLPWENWESEWSLHFVLSGRGAAPKVRFFEDQDIIALVIAPYFGRPTYLFLIHPDGTLLGQWELTAYPNLRSWTQEVRHRSIELIDRDHLLLTGPGNLRLYALH